MDTGADISIHALLAESDRFIIVGVLLYPDISIHALLAESDLPAFASIWQESLFLSTLSLRRATKAGAQNQKRCKISIHALLAESDNKQKYGVYT